MSNLLKKASIITTPTAYDDGRILSVKPSENIYGPELVTNGDFSNGTTGWSSPDYNSTLSIVNGQMKIVSTLSLGRVVQAITTEVGKKYLISATTTNINSSTGIQIKVSNGANLDGATYNSEFNATTNPLTITHRFIATATTTYIGSSQGSSVGQSALLDNVSVVEDLSGDFDFERGSAATRVNAQGLVENVQILSSELVQNGSFSEIGSEEVLNGDFSQEGSELITNGDFSNGETDWFFSAECEVVNSQARIYSSDGGFQYIRQTGVLDTAKQYKLEFDVISSNGADLGITGASNVSTSVLGKKTVYFNPASTYLQINRSSGVTDVVIDNVSVVEVGQDWLPKFSGTGDWYITDKLNFENVNGGSRQNNVFVIGKTYKITLDYVFTSGTRLILPYDGSNFPSDGKITSPGSATGYTYYYTPISNTSLNIYSDGNGNGSVDNISVKEVGQDWSIIDSDANNYVEFNQTQGTARLKFLNTSPLTKLQSTAEYISGKKYKLIVDVAEVVSGGIKIDAAGVQQTYNSVGVQESIIQPTGNSFIYFYRATADVDITLNSISLKEITDDTNIPRINYEGFSYQDVLGSELITNGDFATNSDWSENGGANAWSISGGKANCVAFASLRYFEQTNALATSGAGKTYKVVFTVSNYSQGIMRINVGGYKVGAAVTSNGTHTQYIAVTNASSNKSVYLQSNANTILSVDNVSVKEITGQEVVPNSGCGSWLFEPQSTNLITYSEDFSQSVWNNSTYPVTITSNSIISPDGNLNGNLIAPTSGSSRHAIINLSTAATSGTTYTLSAFIKKGGSRYVVFGDAGDSLWRLVTADLDNGVITNEYNSSGTITAFGNGWYRITCQTTRANSGLIYFVIGASETNSNSTLPYFDNTSLTVYAYGCQLEELSYATSYIPTDGATSTRLQDIANNSGNSDLISSTEGVLYVEIAALTDLGSYRLISLNSDNSASNRITIAYDIVNNQIYGQCVAGGVSQALFTTQPTSISDFNKIALKYKANDLAFWVNGVEVGTDTSASIPTNLNRLSFYRADAAAFFFGKNKALAVWKEALTDTELELLTAPAPEFPTFTLDFDTIAEQFTFTRGSEATFVNEQGLIQSTNELGVELVTNGSFDTNSDWSANGWVISNGQASNSLSGPGHNLFQGNVTSVGGTFKVVINTTISAGSVVVMLGGGTGGYNVIGEATTSGTFTYYGVSNGTDNRILLQTGNGTTVGSVSIENVSVKEVISATNTPRIDYSTGVEAFLLEPQSTNLITYSEDFSQWTIDGQSSIISNSIISPDGTLNATKLIAGSTNGRQAIKINNSSIGDLAFSIFAKKGEYSVIQLTDARSGTAYINFDLDNGNVGSSEVFTGEIKSLGNDWYRCIATYNSAADIFSFRVSIAENSTSGRLETFSGNGSDGVYIYGAQIEQSTYATSHIPTDGASATRNGETCVDATPTINSEEGVLYAEISALADGTNQRWISIGSGSNANRVSILFNATNRVSCSVRGSSSAIYSAYFNIGSQTNNTKVAIRYKNSDFAFFVNGVKVDSQQSGSLSFNASLSELSFDSADGGSKFYGNTKGLQVFDKALSDYQLKQLTTI